MSRIPLSRHAGSGRRDPPVEQYPLIRDRSPLIRSKAEHCCNSEEGVRSLGRRGPPVEHVPLTELFLEEEDLRIGALLWIKAG